MTLFVKRILILALILIGIFSSVNYFQSCYNIEPAQYKKQYQTLFSETCYYEGIIIGTSHAVYSMRPSILDKSGINFYNFAFDAANPKFYYNWYNQININRSHKIKYCLLGIDFFMFDGSWLYRFFERDSEYFPSEFFLHKLINSSGLNRCDLIINRIPFIKYRKQLKYSLMMLKADEYYDIENYDRGYIPCKSLATMNNRYVPKLKYTIDSEQIEYLKLLIKKMLSDRIKIIFVMSPEYGITVEEYNKMKSIKIINSIAKKFNIPILNYNTELRSKINNNISLFSDWGHMNHKGAEEFSKKLATDIKALLEKTCIFCNKK